MYRKKICSYVLLLTSVVALLLNMNGYSLVANAQVTPTVSISPQLTAASINETFSLNVSVSQVTNLCSWQAFIYFRNDILEAESFVEGPFLSSYGVTTFDGSFNNTYNATDGELWMWDIRMWSGYGVNGSGTLATVTFQAKQGGTSPLTLEYVILGNSTAQPISCTISDGTVAVGPHSISCTPVIRGVSFCSPYSCYAFAPAVGRGFSDIINVTASNKGGYPETFNVTFYANATAIATQTVSLAVGASTNVTLNWNTTDFATGNYTISASVTLAPGETNSWTGPFTYGTVQVTKVGNLGGPYNSTNPTPTFGHFTGKVTGTDLALFLQCYHGTAPKQWIYLGDLGGPYNSTTPTPTFFKCDGKVDGKDLALFLECYHGTGP